MYVLVSVTEGFGGGGGGVVFALLLLLLLFCAVANGLVDKAITHTMAMIKRRGVNVRRVGTGVII